MIVKFFKSLNRTKASPGNAIKYLAGSLDGSITRDGARLVRGDHMLSLALAESIDRKNQFTVGCLSFKEQNLSESVKQKIMSDFEKTLMPGLQENEYNISWIEHKDKDRLELNFFIPRTELTTGTDLQPFFAAVDMKKVNLWKDCINIEHKLHAPQDEPQFTSYQPHWYRTTNNKSVQNAGEIKQYSNDYFTEKVKLGEINSRLDIIEFLKDAELQPKPSKNYISILPPPADEHSKPKRVRLSGNIFGENADEFIRESRTKTTTKYHERNKDKLTDFRAELAQLISRDAQRNQSRYAASRKRAQARAEKQSAELTISNDSRVQQTNRAELGTASAEFTSTQQRHRQQLTKDTAIQTASNANTKYHTVSTEISTADELSNRNDKTREKSTATVIGRVHDFDYSNDNNALYAKQSSEQAITNESRACTVQRSSPDVSNHHESKAHDTAANTADRTAERSSQTYSVADQLTEPPPAVPAVKVKQASTNEKNLSVYDRIRNAVSDRISRAINSFRELTERTQETIERVHDDCGTQQKWQPLFDRADAETSEAERNDQKLRREKQTRDRYLESESRIAREFSRYARESEQYDRRAEETAQFIAKYTRYNDYKSSERDKRLKTDTSAADRDIDRTAQRNHSEDKREDQQLSERDRTLREYHNDTQQTDQYIDRTANDIKNTDQYIAEREQESRTAEEYIRQLNQYIQAINQQRLDAEKAAEQQREAAKQEQIRLAAIEAKRERKEREYSSPSPFD